MTVMTGVLAVLGLVVAAGGASKMIAPEVFAETLRTLGVPGGPVAARCAGALELVIGTTAAVIGGRAAAVLVAAMYSVFAAMVVVARRAGAPTCGCFGSMSAPPTTLHLLVNVAAAILSALAAVAAPPGLADALIGQGARSVLYLGIVLIGVWAVVAALTRGDAPGRSRRS